MASLSQIVLGNKTKDVELPRVLHVAPAGRRERRKLFGDRKRWREVSLCARLLCRAVCAANGKTDTERDGGKNGRAREAKKAAERQSDAGRPQVEISPD